MNQESPSIPIRAVSRLTGLSPHVLRAWEKRYGVPTPERTTTNRRLYPPDQVERLRLLAALTNRGFTIGQVVDLPPERLRTLTRDMYAPATSAVDASPTGLLGESVDAMRAFDLPLFEAVLARAAVSLSRNQLVEELAAPLLREMGDLWAAGELGVANEHLCSATLRSFLATQLTASTPPPGAPVLVCTTVAGDRHEFGALLAALMGSSGGWRVAYLGPDLPAADIGLAVRQIKAEALAISVVYPASPQRAMQELKRLRRELPATPILLGGRGMPSLGSLPDDLHCLVPANLSDIPDILADLRRNAPPRS